MLRIPRGARRVIATAALFLAGAPAVGCEAPSPFDPRTAAAARIADLGWVMIAVAAVVCLAVFVALAGALGVGRRRAGGVAGSPPAATGESSNGVVVVAGMALPAVIIAGTLGYTIYILRLTAGSGGPGGAGGLHAGHAGIGPATSGPGGAAGAPEAAPLVVELTGHQWWWEVRYPQTPVTTANEVHIPAGRPVRLAVTSGDVIHSFWVPQVAGKVDAIPGKTNSITIRVEQPGAYRGLCAEFCGLQHAQMHVHLIVEAPADFARWLAAQGQEARPAADSLAQRGQQVFRASCAECHTVRGGEAAGTGGPDLTHVVSRRTLGGGIHENTPANRAGWTADAPAMKPGNKMPRLPLSGNDLRAVLAYLEGLE